MKSYVYIYKHPISNTPFYVGKGKDNRALSHLRKAQKQRKGSFESNVVRKCRSLLKNNLTPRVEIVFSNLTDADAKRLEIEQIAKYKRLRDGGVLVNETLGGDGTVGLKQTPEHIEKRTAQRRGKLMSDDARIAMRGKRKHSSILREAAKERANRLSEKERVSNFFLGRNLSEEHKQKISQTMKARSIKPKSFAGELNHNARYGTAWWNEEIKSFTCLKSFCLEIGINMSTARNTLRENRPVRFGKFAGFQLLSLTRRD
jgi:hypothetical protein